VFAYLGPTRIYENTIHTGKSRLFYWLGLTHGHWDAEVSDEDTTVEDTLDREKVNMGIAIVIPVEKILEVINQEAFWGIRNEKIRAINVASPTSDSVLA